MNNQLLEYVRQCLTAGVSKEEISQTLKSSGGWLDEDIEQAFSALKGENVSKEEPKEVEVTERNVAPPDLGKVIVALSFVLLIPLVVLFIIFAVSPGTPEEPEVTSNTQAIEPAEKSVDRIVIPAPTTQKTQETQKVQENTEAEEDNNSNEGSVERVAAVECFDTDGGYDVYAQGIVTGMGRCIYDGITQDCDGPPKTEEDVCRADNPFWKDKSDTSILEYFCGDDDRLTVDTFKCPKGCADGACIK